VTFSTDSFVRAHSGGRQRRIDERAEQIRAALRAPQLAAPAAISTAMGVSVAASVAVIGAMGTQIVELARELEAGFESHPDAEVVRSLPGLVHPRRNNMDVI
jgi:hypothetical protein